MIKRTIEQVIPTAIVRESSKALRTKERASHQQQWALLEPSQAACTLLQPYYGGPCSWVVKECEWRFNGNRHQQLPQQYTYWYTVPTHAAQRYQPSTRSDIGSRFGRLRPSQ